MRIHLAGLCSSQYRTRFINGQLFPKFILESFFYLEDWLFELPTFHPDNFLLDSGAYTFIAQKKAAKVDWKGYVEKYAELIVNRGIKYFFELDIDKLVGLDEVERLRELLERLTGKKSIPVFHRSRGQQYWLDMIQIYDYVAIGGIVTKEIKAREHKYLRWFLQTAREKKTKVHGLGYTNSKGLEKYPFYSVDSTSWLGSIWAILYQFDGKAIKQVRKPENSRMTDYKILDRHNLKSWIKFQNYAEDNL